MQHPFGKELPTERWDNNGWGEYVNPFEPIEHPLTRTQARKRAALRAHGRRVASITGEANTGRIVARKIAWVEEDGTIVHSGVVRRMPAKEAA